MATASRSLLFLLACLSFSFAQAADEPAAQKLRFSEVVAEAGPDTQRLAWKDGKQDPLHVRNDAIVANQHIQSCTPTSDDAGQWRLLMTLNAEGADRFHKATERLKGRQIAVVIEDKIISAPIIQEAIAGGVVTISGNLTQAELQKLADAILPAKKEAAAKD